MRVSFKMKLHKGQEKEYKRRHDAIWPELVDLLKVSGMKDYSIFLDEETNTLFAVYTIDNPKGRPNLAQHAIMKKWWDYMKDIMYTHADNSPITQPLKEVFYLK